MSLTFPRKHRDKVISHMETNPNWTIYSIAKLLNYSNPTDLLGGLSSLTRQELAVHGRVEVKDCMNGWRLKDG